MDFSLTDYKGKPSIKIIEMAELIQDILCENVWFKDLKSPNLKLEDEPSFTINDELVKVSYQNVFVTYLLFESESLQKKTFEWLEYFPEILEKKWKATALEILKKLQSDNITLIKDGFLELKIWIENFKSTSINHLIKNIDLALFKYEYENYDEGDLWLNPLFDNILTKYKNELNQTDLFNLIYALYNKNEKYADCKATHTAINYLLENRTPEIENSIVKVVINALESHDSGHRFFECSLLDRLVDNILPTFSVISIIKLLQNLTPDNILGEHYGGHGDDFISLAHIALKKKPNLQQTKILTDLIKKYNG